MQGQRGKNIVDIQQMNRSLVIRTIQKNHRTTRAEISKATGLNKATVTNIVSDLINWGAVREVGLATGKSGRRTIVIELATENYAIIGGWLTRRHFIVGIFDIYGECRSSERFSIGLSSPIEELLDKMSCQIKQVQEQCRNQSVLGIALALPGPYIKKEGKIALLTERQDWKDVDIVNRLKEVLDADIVTEHDTNAAVMAEWCYTENYDEDASILCIMVGQGVGAGVMVHGQLMTGCLGVAGELGHMSIRYDGKRCECGNRGCLEQYCSTISIQRRVKELLEEYPETTCTHESSIAEIIGAYKQGDALARYVIDDAARYLGYGIANAVNLFNPSKVIIGDELSEAGDRFLNIIKSSVKDRVLPKIYENMEITLSTLSDSVLRGVCMSLMEEIVHKPEAFMQTEEHKGTKQELFVGGFA